MAKKTKPPMLDKKLYVDMFGRQIEVGDYIVYGAVDGRSGTLRAGQVLALTSNVPSEWSSHETPEPKIFAKSWSNFRQESVFIQDRERGKLLSGRQKNVTLGFLDRLIVVSAENVGAKVKADLAGPAFTWGHEAILGSEND